MKPFITLFLILISLDSFANDSLLTQRVIHLTDKVDSLNSLYSAEVTLNKNILTLWIEPIIT